MDEGKTGSKPGGLDVYALDKGRAGKLGDNPRVNKRGHEEILDRKPKPQRNIETGDLVMLNSKNIKSEQPTRKFTTQFFGPFKVLEKKGDRRSNSISRLAGR